jgi:protocatechuate 3,4-dioxygenase beta subunit
MRDITLDNITEAATASFEGLPDARRRELMQSLVQHLHGFARSTALTHAEWQATLAFLHRVGDISTGTRSEFTLLSDVLGLSSLVDLLGSRAAATPGSVLGPFHAAGSPWKDNPADLTPGNAGEVMLLRGRVCNPQGGALPDATLDLWQNAANGLYWQLDPSQPSDNLRCRLRVGAQGEFEVRTIRPQPYQIPTDGPVWHDVVGPAGRTAWRPAHLHLIVSAPGHRTLVTELFPEGDPWLARDAVFGVRQALVRPINEEAGADAPVMRVELVLAPEPA